MKVCHVVTGLNTGGAEMMLRKLVTANTGGDITHSVIALIGWGPIGDALQERGIRVEALGMRRGSLDVGRLATLVRRLRAERPDVVQTWMYHANLLGGVAARLAGIRHVVWNIRAAHMERGSEKRSSIMLANVSGRLASVLCERIVVNSEAARRIHEGMGYPGSRMVVIPNGFDMETYRPCASAGPEVRAELGMPADARLIGMMARFHPGKEHRTFFTAAALLAAQQPNAWFVLAGDDVTPENPELAAMIDAGLRDRVRLLGRRADLPRLFAALDVCTLTSAYESFPNVLGEAMACGVPCVSTDVGDAARIVGDTGTIVPVRDAESLAHAWRLLLDMPSGERREQGARARRRIEQHFALPAIAERYFELYRSLAAVAPDAAHA